MHLIEQKWIFPEYLTKVENAWQDLQRSTREDTEYVARFIADYYKDTTADGNFWGTAWKLSSYTLNRR